MSLNQQKRTIVILFGSIIVLTLMLIVPISILSYFRRREAAASTRIINDRLSGQQEEQRQGQLAVQSGDLERGLHVRAGFAPTPFEGNRADHEPQVPAPAYTKYNRDTEVARGPQADPSGLVQPSPLQPRPNLSTATASRHQSSMYGGSLDSVPNRNDVPPAYSAVVPHR